MPTREDINAIAPLVTPNMPSLGDEVSYNDEPYIVCGWDAQRFEDELALMLILKQTVLARGDYSSKTATWVKPSEVVLLREAEDLSIFLPIDETNIRIE